jgi:hypothetical protein
MRGLLEVVLMTGILFAVLWPPLWGMLAPAFRFPWYVGVLTGGAGVCLSGIFPPVNPVAAVISAGWMVIALAAWWHRRRKDRQRTLEALGAKARAKIAAMRQAMRERARPRRVYRPVPQGAA